MHVDIKKSTWERASLPDDMTKEQVIKMIDSYSANALANELHELGATYIELYDCEEYLTPDDNQGEVTVELIDGEETIYTNEKDVSEPDPNKVVINPTEIASELAHKRVVEGGCQKIWEDEEEEQTVYTEEAQELFNQYYDEYKNIITGGKF